MMGVADGYLKQLNVERRLQPMDSRRYVLSVTVAKWVPSGLHIHTTLVVFFFLSQAEGEYIDESKLLRRQRIIF